MRIRRVRRLLLPAALAATVLSTAPAPASGAEVARCAGARAQVRADTLPQARKAVRCLLNRIRADRGLRRLRANPRLRVAATRHSADMASRRFFSHDSPGGGTLVTRARRAGYVRPDMGWSVGENIGWGSKHLGTPRAMVRTWVNSPGHKANILTPSFRDVGVGIALGSPRGGDGVTYTTDFGARG